MAIYVRFRADGLEEEAWGLVEGGEVRVVKGSPFTDVAPTRKVLPLSNIREYLPPADPPNIIAIGVNYPAHMRESRSAFEAPSAPLLFFKATTALTAHERPILLPREAPEEVDYEAELVAAIGRKARHVPRDRALEYVAGYTCGNDVSARDCQLRLDRQWARGKSFDTFAPVGPWLVTDLDPSDLAVRARVNGRLLQDGRTRDMTFDVPALVSFLSRQMTLLPGTLIFTGTPGGVGFARTPPFFLRAGDVCEIEIEGVGTLRNPVLREA
ncbi:MAG: fumarylacetoacetate hydrolase family protein [Planctomycetota bacterium]